jgi:peptidyl-dipeptidase Dcp
MLSANAFNWFEQNGGMTRANGQRFRDMVLSKGHTEDYAPMFRNFNGADPQVGPLLKDLGLNADGSRVTAGAASTPVSDGTVTTVPSAKPSTAGKTGM